MNLYKRSENGEFLKHGQHRLPWEGKVEIFEVFKINYSELKYNIKNGRIAELQLNGNIDPNDDDVYLKIKNTITKQSRKDIEKLGRDIGHHGIKTPLILNKDGIIIDGNRRFTAISMLLNGEIKPFTQQDLLGIENIDCVILNVDSGAKSIKTLEYMIQFDDMKKDYNPISRSFSFYDSIIIEKLMTSKELSEYTGMSVKAVENDIRTAELIKIYLKAINSEDISTAISMKLDGPVKEVATNKERTAYFKKNFREWVEILQLAISMQDPTRAMRNMIKGYKGKQNIFSSQITKKKVERAIVKMDIQNTIKAASIASTEEKVNVLKKVDESKKIQANNILMDISKLTEKSKEKNANTKTIQNFSEFIQDLNSDDLNLHDQKRLKNIKIMIEEIINE